MDTRTLTAEEVIALRKIAAAEGRQRTDDYEAIQPGIGRQLEDGEFVETSVDTYDGVEAERYVITRRGKYRLHLESLPLEPATDMNGKPLGPGDYVSFKMYPRGTGRGTLVVSNDGSVLIGHVEYRDMAIREEESGHYYEFNSKGTRLLRTAAARAALPHEELLIVVGWASGNEPLVLKARVSADMGLPLPAEPITSAEMQQVALAAKSALAKVLRARKHEAIIEAPGEEHEPQLQGRVDRRHTKKHEV